MLPFICGFLFYIGTNILTYWIFILLLCYVCSAHINLNRTKTLLYTGISGVCFAVTFFTGNEDVSFYAMFALILLTVLMFSSRRVKDMLLVPIALMLYIILSIMPLSLLQELHPVFAHKISFLETSYTYVSLAIDLILFAALLYLRKVLTRYEIILPLSRREIAGCFGVLFFCFVDIGLLFLLNTRNISPLYYYIWLVILIGFFVCGMGYYFYNLIDARVRFYKQTLRKNDTEYLKLRLETLQQNRENEEHVKRMRHDLKNHLVIINTLCDEGRYEELRNYTATLNEEAASIGNPILTGNEIADMVIHSKMEIALQQNIPFTFNGSLEGLHRLDAPDICGLLSNAYDNALEACGRLSDSAVNDASDNRTSDIRDNATGYIRTEVNTTANFLVIKITNPVTAKIPIENNCLSTTKKEKHSHGYGTDIMRRIAAKYKGNCAFECTDTEFTVKIRLPLE